MQGILRPIVALVSALAALTSPATAQNTRVEAVESQYNSIYVYQNPTYVTMTFGHNERLYTESMANRFDQTELPVTYTRFMTLPLAYRAETSDVLEIGMGGGSTIWYLHKTFPELTLDVVELDPAVVELARKYFFVKPGEKLNIDVRDGRIFLRKSDKKYDAILVDAYRGPFVPFHLLTREFFEIVEDSLKPGGVVAQNVEPSTMLYDAALATIASVFDHLDVYRASGNYVVIAYNGEAKSDAELAARAAEIDRTFSPRYRMSEMIEGRTVPEKIEGDVLTDDFAPVEALHATERHNRRPQD